jgi:hypothetical protein
VTEIRPLTEVEFLTLLIEADYSETEFISKIVNPYDFFKSYAIEQSGLVINGRVIYWGALLRLRNKNELWTVVNKDVQEQFTLYKEAKKAIYSWLEKHTPIYATMHTGNIKNQRWVEKMKFTKEEENDKFVTYMLERTE